jgi:multicomponent Na+:H+ antiporter subunit D
VTGGAIGVGPATATAVVSLWPLVAVLLPLLGLAAFALKRPRTAALALVGVVGATFAVTLAFVPAVLGFLEPTVFVLHMTPELWLELRVDAAGAIYGATVAGLALLASVYAFGYLPEGAGRARFFGFLMATLTSTLGVAYAGNLITFLLFYEAFSVLTYALVVHERTPAALAAGAKYIAYVLIGGSLVLMGVLLTYSFVGDLTFAPGGLSTAGVAPAVLRWTFWCFVAGFGVKAALVPLHGWVPDAHPAAPAPFSALLSGVMVAAGAFGILRVVFEVFGAERLRALGVLPWLGAIAATTVLVGALFALGQPDLKRRLAYSTISQMGYLTLAISLLGATATAGALVHLVHHAFLKGTLFFCAGIWIHGHGARRLVDLRGMATRTPWTAAAFALATFGMIGLPPLSGFVSKWWLGLGMLEVEAGWALAVLLLGALLAAGYLLPVVHALYFETPDAAAADAPKGASSRGAAAGAPSPRLEAPLALLAPTLVAAALTLVFGVGSALTGFPFDVARRVAAVWFGGG